MPESLRQFVLDRPTWIPVLAVAACSVGLSALSIGVLAWALGLRSANGFGLCLGLGVVIPLLVTVPVASLALRLLHETEAARQAALALAWNDGLTGLLTRRRFLELAQRELNLARRTGHPVCVALMDLDDFKRVNDRHGHAVGDALLRAVARAAASVLRSTDLAARWGGEEFALVLPGMAERDAVEVMHRALEAVAQVQVMAGRQAVSCTASIGVAQWQGESPDIGDLIQRADTAMYRAKQVGKACVSVAPAPGRA